MFGKINFSFSKNIQPYKNTTTPSIKPTNSSSQNNNAQTFNSAVNSNTSNQQSQKPYHQKSSLSNPAFSNFNNKQKIKNNQ